MSTGFVVWLAVVSAVCSMVIVEAGPVLQHIGQDNSITSEFAEIGPVLSVVQDNSIASGLPDTIAEPLLVLQQKANIKSADIEMLLKRIDATNEKFLKNSPNDIADHNSYLESLRRAFTEYRLAHSKSTTEPNFYNYGW